MSRLLHSVRSFTIITCSDVRAIFRWFITRVFIPFVALINQFSTIISFSNTFLYSVVLSFC